jgi:L-lactate dehydrogenase complex protein LldG
MAVTSKESFIAMVSNALGHQGDLKRPQYPRLKIRREIQRQKAVTIEARAQAKRAELTEKLAETALNAGWKVFANAEPSTASDYISNIVKEKGADLIVRSTHKVLNDLRVDHFLSEMGVTSTIVTVKQQSPREQLIKKMSQAQIGITGVDYAIAETGTCVLVPRKGVSRLVSLLPPVHIAVVEEDQIYENLDDLFALRRLEFMQNRSNMGSYLSLITGPSRTADIEQTLVTGVHGPVEVHMIILKSY